MLNYTLIGNCNLGDVYSYDWSWKIVIVTADGDKLGLPAIGAGTIGLTIVTSPHVRPSAAALYPIM